MNTMQTLVKREFWENRSLIIAPLVIAAFIVLSSVWGVVGIQHDGHQTSIANVESLDQVPDLNDEARSELQQAINLSDDRKQTGYALSILLFAGVLSSLTCIVVFFYLIDCLYAERRDRSILFWKSMPLSDTQVVLHWVMRCGR